MTSGSESVVSKASGLAVWSATVPEMPGLFQDHRLWATSSVLAQFTHYRHTQHRVFRANGHETFAQFHPRLVRQFNASRGVAFAAAMTHAAASTTAPASSSGLTLSRVSAGVST